MAVRYGYFDSATNEYPYTSKEFGQLISGLITNGIIKNYLNEFEVVRNSGTSVSVKSGRLWISDHWVENTDNEVVSFTTPDISKGEKNLYVIVRLDLRSGFEGANIVVTESSTQVHTEDFIEFILAILHFSTSYKSLPGSYYIDDARSFATSKVTPSGQYGLWNAEFQNVCNNMISKQVSGTYSQQLAAIAAEILLLEKLLLSLSNVFTITKTYIFSGTDYADGFDKYDETEKPVVKVCGNVCYLAGAMRYFGNHGDRWLNGGTYIDMGKLPSGVPIPPTSIICKNHASTGSSYMMTIWGKDTGDSAGRITASRICGYERWVNGKKYTAGQYRPAVVGDRVITAKTTNYGEWLRLDSMWIADQDDISLEDPNSSVSQDVLDNIIDVDSIGDESILIVE